MAKSNAQKLERLHKLSTTFNNVSEAIIGILENNDSKLHDHIDTVKSALISSGHDEKKSLKAAREMIFCLRDNKEMYKAKHPKQVNA